MTKSNKFGLKKIAALMVYAGILLGALIILSPAGSAPSGDYAVAASSMVGADVGTAFTTDSVASDSILTIRKRVDEVNVLFIATDRHGKFVRSLDQNAFQL